MEKQIFERQTASAEETMDFSARLAELLSPGDLITLEGDLGAGKTTFTKGLAKGLGVRRTVNSPTFTIIKEYQGRMPLYHMDVYRLEGSDEELGFEEYFEGEGVTIVEWASIIQDQLPSVRLDIFIYHTGEEQRRIEMTAYGEHYITICKEIMSS